MRSLLLAVKTNNFDDTHLKEFIHARDLVEHLEDVLDRLGHRALREEYESVALASCVRLGREERLDEFRRVGDEVLKFAVDRVHGEYGVLAHIRVSVFEACAAGGDEGFEEFGILRDLLEETEGCTTDVFVWMLLNCILCLENAREGERGY